MYQLKQIIKFDFINLLTNPMWWSFSIGLPLLLSLLLGFLTKGSYGKAVTSFEYYRITIMVFGVLNTASLAANCFLETRIAAANLRLCTSPVPAFFIHFSKVIATVLFAALGHTLTAVLLYLAAGASLSPVKGLSLWGLLLAGEFFSASLGITLCCLLKNEEFVNQILSNFITIFCLLGGVFFPLQGFGRLGSVAGSLSPVTWILTSAFRIIYNEGYALFWLVILALFLAAILLNLFNTFLFHREDFL